MTNTPITIETTLNWHAQASREQDGLRLTFNIPVHADLLPHLTNPTLKSMVCWWRITRSVRYSQELAAGAEVRLTGYIETVGERGRQVFHVKTLDVLTPKARPMAAERKKAKQIIAKAMGMKADQLFPPKKPKNISQTSIFQTQSK